MVKRLEHFIEAASGKENTHFSTQHKAHRYANLLGAASVKDLGYNGTGGGWMRKLTFEYQSRKKISFKKSRIERTGNSTTLKSRAYSFVMRISRTSICPTLQSTSWLVSYRKTGQLAPTGPSPCVSFPVSECSNPTKLWKGVSRDETGPILWSLCKWFADERDE